LIRLAKNKPEEKTGTRKAAEGLVTTSILLGLREIIGQIYSLQNQRIASEGA